MDFSEKVAWGGGAVNVSEKGRVGGGGGERMSVRRVPPPRGGVFGGS